MLTFKKCLFAFNVTLFFKKSFKLLRYFYCFFMSYKKILFFINRLL